MTIPTAPDAPSSNFQPKDHAGSLVRIVTHAYNPNATTPWGEKAEAIVDVDVIEGRIQQGEHFGPQRLTAKLVRQLGQVVGQEVYGRIVATPGSSGNPAITLGKLAPGDEAKVNAWRQWMGPRLTQADPNAAARAPQYEEPDPWAAPPTPYAPTQPPAHWQQPQQQPAQQPPWQAPQPQPYAPQGAPAPQTGAQPYPGSPPPPNGGQAAPAAVPPTWNPAQYGQPVPAGPPTAPPPDDPPPF